jgi:molecular chaperone HscB
MNYFTFYGLPLVFFPDQQALRRLFYAKSKQYHPDYFTLEPEQRQQEIMELASYNNSAYLTLQDEDKRMRYILELHGFLGDDSTGQLPGAFLAEMMDINEAIMSLEFDFDASAFEKIQREAAEILQQLYADILPVLQDINAENVHDHLPRVKDFYLKKRYLLRIKENLAKFASL